MKNKSKELDVDFIGGQGSLTKEEEQAISEYIKNQKKLKIKRPVRKTITGKRKKVLSKSQLHTA
jgi:hypothetical protein